MKELLRELREQREQFEEKERLLTKEKEEKERSLTEEISRLKEKVKTTEEISRLKEIVKTIEEKEKSLLLQNENANLWITTMQHMNQQLNQANLQLALQLEDKTNQFLNMEVEHEERFLELHETIWKMNKRRR